MDNVPQWVVAVSALLNVVFTVGGAFYINYMMTQSKVKSDEADRVDKKEASEKDQAFQMMKELLGEVRKDVTRISNDMDKLEKEHLSCREDNATLKAELKASVNLQKIQGEEIESLKRQLGIIKIEATNKI